jgi:ABC-type transport system involved in multi-copper enzyme maturation permease subunit
MFRHIAAFEFRYHVWSPVFAATAVIFFLLTFGAVTSDQIQIGAAGNVKVNSPYAMAQTLGIMSVFAIFIMAAFVSNVIVRDDDTGFGPIVRSTRVSKFDYLFGRFTGAFLAGCLAFAAVPLAMLIGSIMPWLDPEKVGPFRPGDYLYVYFLICVPTLFVTGAGCFALATATRSMAGTYVGVIGFLMLYFIAVTYFDKPEYDRVVGLWEPFGLGAFQTATKYWTATERNSQLPAIAGLIFYNRVIWLGIAFALLAVAWLAFRPEKKARKARKREDAARQAAAREAATVESATPANGRLPQPKYDFATSRSQLFALARFDMIAVFRSPAFFVLLGIAFLNSMGALWSANEQYDNTIYPVTRVMIQTLSGSFTFMILIVAIYYAGELVWRDRERGVYMVVDATPAPDWAFVMPKVLAIVLVLLASIASSTVAAMIVQLLRGYTNLQISHYLLWYIVPSAIDFALIAVLAVFVQTLVPHKTVGWLVMLLFIVAQTTLGKLGFEDNLYQYNGGSETPLSDMNGLGNFAEYRYWFRAYWSACAVVLVVLTYALWRRGAAPTLSKRVSQMPRRLVGTPSLIAGGALLAMIALGVYIFRNTHVLNEYRTAVGDERWTADYEKTLIGFEKVPLPRITDVTLRVDLYPRETRAVTTGHYAFVNRTDKPLENLHVRWDRQLEMQRLEIAGATLEKEFPQFQYRIYRFAQPLAPGATGSLEFTSVREQKGFRNRGNDKRIVSNGTFINDQEIAPSFGVTRDSLLQDRAKRRKYGLPPELRTAKLEDESARAHQYIRPDSDFVNADITVSTDADQVPIAPGYRISEEVQNGRRIIHYRTDAPILQFFSVQSAAYAIKRDRWKDVELAVYYDPAHAYNVDRMIKAMKLSLDYTSTNFSPYQFKQLRILEFPDYEQFAQSFANTVPYSEGIGFIANYKDPEKIDMVTYVTAHEIGHQWWAHQIIGADMQGMTLLSETLAQYTALMVMEHLYGPDQIRKFLRFELDRYLRRRGGEMIEELPLERVENQAYIHYQKGSLAMYLLKDEIGEDAVNRALRGLLAEYAFKGAPYPTSKDLLRHLRAEAGPEHQQLITDLFQKITLYDVKVTGARKQKRADGKWDVTLDVDARKLYADGQGLETETPLDESFDVGLFTAEPGRKEFSRKSVLTFERQSLHSGTQKVTLVAASEPSYAGVDPYNKRVDRNSEDNVTRVE